MTVKVQEIRKRARDKKMTIRDLEAKAGFSKGRIYSILYNRSKSISIQVMQKIADCLDCSMVDLIDIDDIELNRNNIDNESCIVPQIKTLDHNKNWNIDLFGACITYIISMSNAEKFSLDKVTLMRLVDELYDYSLKSSVNSIDKIFARWLLKKTFSKELESEYIP